MNKIIEIAEKEIGYKETPDNSNMTKYGKWFGFDGVAWCAIFVSWVYEQAGISLKNIQYPKGIAGCQSAYLYFKKNNKITDNPEPGDIVLFYWNSDGSYDHAGIFVKDISATKFESIEGNTSINNQSNGGEVMRRIRNKKFAIFIHI